MEADLGLDVAKRKVDVALLVGEKFKTKVFSNDAAGFRALTAWLATQRKPASAPVSVAPSALEQTPSVPGQYLELSGEERGMLFTVLWHRDRAAHGRDRVG